MAQFGPGSTTPSRKIEGRSLSLALLASGLLYLVVLLSSVNVFSLSPILEKARVKEDEALWPIPLNVSVERQGQLHHGLLGQFSFSQHTVAALGASYKKRMMVGISCPAFLFRTAQKLGI